MQLASKSGIGKKASKSGIGKKANKSGIGKKASKSGIGKKSVSREQFSADWLFLHASAGLTGWWLISIGRFSNKNGAGYNLGVSVSG